MANASSSGTRGQALATLKNLSGFLDASIGSLSAASIASNAASSSPNGTSSNAQASLPTILSDLHSLFALVSKETTNLSLAFAPPKEHWDAVDATAKKLNDLSSKVVYGLGLLREQTASQNITEHILAKQWRLASVTVFECLKELSNTCFTIYSALGDKSIQSSQRKLILTNTSLVWKAVERTEKLPEDERTAFIIAWKGILGTFEDALEEVEVLTKREVKGKGKAENQDELEDGHEEEEDDDDEDEFDFDDLEDDDSPISEDELKMTQAAYQYMKLVKALLRKVGSLQNDRMPYGQFADFGYRLASLQDELASALQPPQDDSSIRKETQNYQVTASALIKAIVERLPLDDLATSFESISLNSNNTVKSAASDADTGKWFSTCQEHLQNASNAILALCEDEP